jgi:hypothetical protein
MKKILGTVLALGLVMAGVAGCAKEESPAETVAPVTAVRAGGTEAAVQEAVKGLEGLPTVEGVTSAVQSSTQALIREKEAIVGGVTAAVQSSTQDAVLKEGAAAETTGTV